MVNHTLETRPTHYGEPCPGESTHMHGVPLSLLAAVAATICPAVICRLGHDPTTSAVNSVTHDAVTRVVHNQPPRARSTEGVGR